jgi:hypothetical protein
MTYSKIGPTTLVIISVSGGTILNAHAPAAPDNAVYFEAPFAPHHPEREYPQPEQRLRARAVAAVNTVSYSMATSNYELIEGDPWVLRVFG